VREPTPRWRPRPLFNPGPVALSPRVRSGLSWPDVSHRDPDFLAVLHEARAGVGRVYRLPALEANDTVVFAGSGTTAVEAAVLTSAAEGGSTLCLVNGAYGERIRSMLERAGVPHTALVRTWGQEIPVAQIEEAVAADPAVRRVVLVHHETSTGSLNLLGPVSRLCAERGLDLVVDAVSSFGAEDLDVADTVRAWIATSSNKCLESVAGLAVCSVPREPAGATAGPVPLTLDLRVHQAAQRAGSVAFTLPPHAVACLALALDELADTGGWEARHARYVGRRRTVRDGMARHGVHVPASSTCPPAASLTLFELPAPWTYQRLQDGLDGFGQVVYPAQGAYAQRFFRVATMGGLADEEVDRLVQDTGSVLAGAHA
jgi:2-aminoethylphosphonate-pyruvate transaminase